MSDKKIIFFDIDGTLLDDDKKMPLTAEKAVFALKELGHEVAIATGRAPFMFKDIREQLEIDSYVSFNGQYVVLRGGSGRYQSVEQRSLASNDRSGPHT